MRLVVRRLSCIAVVALLYAASVQAQVAAAPINVYDGFETPALSRLWEDSRFEPGAVVMQTQVVRAGKQAVAVSVRSKDKFEAGQHGSADSERDELLEARALTAVEGRAYEYSFSMFFPADFPIVPTRLVIAQWKQYCGKEDAPCSDDSPVLALRYIGGALRVTQDLAGQQTILFEQKRSFVDAGWTSKCRRALRKRVA